MGYYINKVGGKDLPAKGKAIQIIADGGTRVDNEFQENLICVVDNGFFEAAAYCYSLEEFNEFNKNDGRSKIWVTHPKAKELSDYKGS